MFEVKSAGNSIGITSWFKDAEIWFKETNQNMPAEILKFNTDGSKSVIKARRGHGFSIRSISGVQPATQAS